MPQPNQFTYNMAKYFDKVFEPKGIHYKTHRKNKVRLLNFYGDDGDGGDDDIDITQLSGWGIPERPSPSSPSSLGALEGSKHGQSVATGQPAEKPTGTAPNPCEAAERMRKRSVGINIRVTVTEKKKVTMLARKCGLSLSEYLRQRALGYEPGGHPPKEVFDVLDKLDEIAEGCTPSNMCRNRQLVLTVMRDLLIGGN